MKVSEALVFTLLWTIYGGKSRAFNILGLFFHPGRSHYDMFKPLMHGLADRGHNVTVVSHFPEQNLSENYRHLQLNTMYEYIEDLKEIPDQKPYGTLLAFWGLYEWGVDICDVGLNSSATKEILRTKGKWDLIILEEFNTDCALGVAHLLDAPFIALSSCALMPWHYERMANPLQPAYVPALFLPHSERMTLLQRVTNWITVHSFRLGYKWIYNRKTNEQFERLLGPRIPDVAELVRRTSLIFLNQHFSLSGSKPLSRSVIEIGGIHIQPQKPLDKELQEIIDGAKHGVIVISWGSLVRASTLPDDKRRELLAAFSKLQQRIIWKWENDTMPDKPSNVFIKKWLPQRDILCHPKVKVFMSHGGLLGSSEAAYCGVPMVVTPISGDQFLNAAAVVHRGMAILLNLNDISRDNVLKAIQSAMEPKTLEAVKKVSFAFKNRPKTPLEEAIWWSEYVAETKGAPLTRSHAVDLPWYIYYSLDVYAIVLVGLVVILAINSFLIRLVFCRRGKSQNDQRKTKKKKE